MTRISGKLAAGAMLLALALGCNPEQPAGPRSPAFQAMATPATLVLHVVAPQATDPAIDQGLDDHYAWLDTTAHSNHRLFVFLPGTGQNPSIFQLVQRDAARLGYHVNQTYPLNTAQMLTGHAVQRALNINDGVSRQLALILIFDLNRHETVPCSFFV